MGGTKIVMGDHVEKSIQPHIATPETALEAAYPLIESFVVERLLSGFSGAVIVMGKPLLKAGQGQPKTIVIKIAPEIDITNETNAYKTFVRQQLPNGNFPHLIHEHSETPVHCLIYELAFDEGNSFTELFEQIQTAPDMAKTTIYRLFTSVMVNWHSHPSRKQESVWSICIEDELLEMDAIEEAFYKSIGVRIPNRFSSDVIGRLYDNPFTRLRGSGLHNLGNCFYFDVVCHGDLNARNVLIDETTGRINLIDFAQTGVGHFCCDFAKLETVIVTELFSRLPFSKKLPIVSMFTDDLKLEDSVFLQHANRFQLDPTCRELFLLVKVIRDSFIDIFSMQPNEDLFKNYKIALIRFLLKSLKYADISRSDKLVAFCELSFLVGSFEESLQRLQEPEGPPTYAIEDIEELSPSFIKRLKRDDLYLSLSTDYTERMGQRGTIGDLNLHLVRGKIKYSKSEWDDAFQEYQKLMEIAKSGKHMWHLSEAFLGLGLIEHVKGKIYRGRDYFMRAKTIKEEQCPYDLEGLAEVFMRLGWGEEDIGALPDSLEYYEKALEYARKSLETPVLVGALYDLGVVYWKLDMIGKADNLFKEGYDLANRKGMHKSIGYHLLGLARVSWSAGKSDTDVLFKNSIDIFKEIGYKRGLAIALTEYGDFLRSQKDVKNSMTVLFEARTLKQSLGEKRELYITETVLAANLLESGDLKGARKLLQDTIRGFESLDVSDSYRKRAEELLSTIVK